MFYPTPSSPHTRVTNNVTRIMLKVLAGLIPGIAIYVYYFGSGLLINLTLAIVLALLAEAALLRIRGKQVQPFLADGSAVVTAALLALTLPPVAPWWMTCVGVFFAIVIAKHLFGGLGYNPFNPAMVGYAVLLVSFPREMTTWLPAIPLANSPPTFTDSLGLIFSGHTPAQATVDAFAGATPLDYVKTQLGLGRDMDAITQQNPLFGVLAGIGWEWVNIGFLLGGLWLIYERVITWHIPAALIAGLGTMAAATFLTNTATHPAPLFHLLSGATMLGAFFIATDPVTAAATPRGKLIYGFAIGALTFIIRSWGGYPDAIAFSVLLLNMAVPLLDQYTQPRVFGRK